MRPYFAFTFFLVILCLVEVGITDEKAEDSTHNALIDTTEVKLSSAISLMPVRFSQESTINLAEREEINKVLKELELSASQLVSRENTLKFGRLLRADGLVFFFI